MSYQVLARKYRPQLFKDVVGQIHVTQTLQNALSLKRIHHAYLFTGARGIGKTTVARILAKALNCEKGVEGQAPIIEPCNACAMCLDIVEGKSIDVQEIDGASNTGVEDVRQIREQVKYLPARGKYKIYIIDEVHMLSTSAFNALLKTLEEPPPHVVFIFATTEVHKIPATILSRCQRYDFRRITASDLATSLKSLAEAEKVTADADALHLIAQEASGSLRDAQSLLDQAVAFCGNTVGYEALKKMFGFLDRTQLLYLLKAILSKDRQGVLNQLNIFYQMGSDLNRLLLDLLTTFKNLFLIRCLGQVPDWLELPREEVETLRSLSTMASMEELDQLFQLAYRGVDDVARSPSPKMMLDVLLIRMTLISEIVPLNQVLEKLDQLSRAGSERSGFAGPKPSRVEDKGLLSLSQETPSPRKDKWEDFVSWLAKEKPQLASIIGHGRLVALEEKQVTLGFEKSSVYGEMLQEEDRRKQLQEYFLKFFGKNLALKSIPVEVDAAPAADLLAKRKSLKESALRHESVKEAANILGAIVEEVRTEVDE